MWFKYVLIGWFTLRALVRIARVDKPTPALSGPDTVVPTLLDGLMIAGVLYFWGSK